MSIKKIRFSDYMLENRGRSCKPRYTCLSTRKNCNCDLLKWSIRSLRLDLRQIHSIIRDPQAMPNESDTASGSK